MRVVKRLVITVLIGGAFSSPYLYAAAPVEDRSNASAKPSPSKAQMNAQAELYYQLQQLQQEVMDLRGQVETQSHEIRRLEQRRKEDYQNLDKRLRAGGGSVAAPAAAGTATATAAVSASTKSAATSAPPPADERNAYQAAFQLLKNQQLKEAETAFKGFIKKYPEGKYTANAYYWLGELYLTADDLDNARTTFELLVERYPEFRKTPDSSFKLAKIYHQQGDDAKAKALLNAIVKRYATSSPSTVQLANAYLDKYFK